MSVGKKVSTAKWG